ncbi:MAG: DMT family transporter [Pseudomonadota bacterium]
MTDVSTNLRQKAWLGPVLLVVGGVGIGLAPIGLRLSEFGPQATALWRYIFALPMLAAFAWSQGLKLGRPPPLALLAGVFFGIDIALWHAALLETSVANATFIVNLGAVGSGLAAWFILKERPTKIWPIAAAIAIAGAAALSFGAAGGGGGVRGDFLALFAAVFVAGYLITARLARRTANAISVMFWATAAEIPVAAIAATLTGEPLYSPQLSWYVAPLFLALFAHAIGQGCIVAGVGLTPAAISGVLMLIQPVTAGLIAWPLFGEALTPVQMAGAALVLFGVWLAGRPNPAKPIPPAP